jgi:predicted transposase/invertase (TIGR01784 family)
LPPWSAKFILQQSRQNKFCTPTSFLKIKRIFSAKNQTNGFSLIKKEISMSFIETTITEHVYNQGRIQGEAQGWIKGAADSKKETAINLLKMGIDVEIINQATGLQKEEIKQLCNQ